MQIFKNRPFSLFGASVAIFAVLALQFDGKAKVLLAILSLILSGLAVILIIKFKSVKRFCSYCIAFFLGVAVSLSSSYFFFDRYFSEIQSGVGEEFVIEGTVTERGSATSFSSSFRVSLEMINGDKNGEDIILECSYPSALQVGDRFRANVTQRAVSSFENYDEEQTYLSDGYTRIFICETVSECEFLSEKSHGLRVRLHKWNDMLSAKLYDAIGEEGGGLAVALLLGNRAFLTEDVTLDFRRAGISHLLALSGMHVSILIGFVELILRKLRVAKLIRAGFVPTVLVGYLALTGFSVSTVRAVLMVCILYLGFLLRADYDSFTAVCSILALLLIFTPYSVLDLSLWMSFLAAASIIVFFPWIRAMGDKIRGGKPRPFVLRRFLANTAEAILVGVVANAALLLLSVYVFGEISLLSIPATLVLSLPMSLLMILSLPLLLFPELSFLSYLCRILSKSMLSAAEFVSNMEDVLLSVGSKTEEMLLIILTVLLIVFAVIKLKRAAMLLSVPILMLVLFGVSCYLTDNAPREYIAASEETGGYSILCEGGEMIATDLSAAFASDTSSLVTIAKENRCTEIDDLVLTAYNDRRPYLIKSLSDRIMIRRIRLPKPADEREQAITDRIAEEAALYGIEISYDIDDLCIEDAKDPYRWQQEPPDMGLSNE